MTFDRYHETEDGCAILSLSFAFLRAYKDNKQTQVLPLDSGIIDIGFNDQAVR
jgi:hypothetical protein